MEIQETNLRGVFLLTPKVFGDARGWFMEVRIDTVFLEDVAHGLSVCKLPVSPCA